MDRLIIEFLASFLIWILFFGLVVLWFIDGKIKKEQVIHALFAALIATLISETIKALFPTLRPFRVDGLPVLTVTVPGGSSFPSGHTAESFALAVTIWLHDKKVGWLYLALALLVGIARVWANVHYPLDILGGVVIGSLVAVGVEKIHLFKLLASITKRK